MSDEQFRAMLEIHTVAPFRVLRAAAPHLREAGKREAAEGREVFRKVVNVTSIAGTQGNLGQVNYATAKAGLVGMTKTLAREWGPFKVNVNAVAFGFVEAAPQIIPLGRPATPDEAAGAIFLLCSPWSNFIHGQVITASGGQTTGMTT
jgi:3-oxoacyl-[acyl-carrier protein] reductase